VGDSIRITLDGSGGCIFIAGQSEADSSAGQASAAGGESVAYTGNRGYIVNKYWDYFSVRMEDGIVEDYYVSGLKFTKYGFSTTYASLQRGNFVELIKSGSSISAVSILEGDRKAFGEVVSITSETINIADADDNENSYSLAGKVSVKDKKNRSADLEDIKEDMYVELTLNAGDEVVGLKFDEDSGDLSGIVDSIRITGTRQITVKDDDGDRHTYYLAYNVAARESARTRDLDYVEEGMSVELTLNSDKEVVWIDITNLTSIDGEVTYIKTSGSKKIEIEKSGGAEDSYYMEDGVAVMRNGSGESLGYIDIGMDVKLYLNDDRKVVRIDVYGSASTVRGEVTSIRTSGSERIWIKRSNGDKENYYLSDDVTIKEGSKTRKLSYVEEGMDVKLTLDGDDEVTRIDIL
jgi:hypothetical protein